MASTMVVTNNTGASLTIAGQDIAGDGGSYAFDAGQIAGVATDITFRAAFLEGSVTFNINGQAFSSLSANVEDLLDQIASGSVSV